MNKKFTKENLIACFPEAVVNRKEVEVVESKYRNWWGKEEVELVNKIPEVKGQVHISKIEEAIIKFISETSNTKYSLAQQNYTLKLIKWLANGYVGFARPNLEAMFHIVKSFLLETNQVNYSSDKVRNWYISLTTKPKARKGIHNETGKRQMTEGLKVSDEIRGVQTIIRKSY